MPGAVHKEKRVPAGRLIARSGVAALAVAAAWAGACSRTPPGTGRRGGGRRPGAREPARDVQAPSPKAAPETAPAAGAADTLKTAPAAGVADTLKTEPEAGVTETPKPGTRPSSARPSSAKGRTPSDEAARKELVTDPASMLGGGNFDNAEAGGNARARFAVLKSLGLGGCRINVYPSRYILGRDWKRPNVKLLDPVTRLARESGVRNVVLLFEYYAEYFRNEGLGTRGEWREIGRAFAERYRPNGTWGEANGVRDWGVTIYSAFNEPERGFGKGGKLETKLYVESLRGLGEGVHSVDPELKVVPGGFMAANAWNDWTLRGLGPALAPLWNDGTLDGIDLHTYYDVQYAPMEKGYGDSAQSNFDDVKRASGVTADIGFYSTEFNYKRREVTEDEAARGFLTGIWDNLGVVKRDGATPATVIAFPWNIFHLAEKDGHYGLCTRLSPWEPTARGKVLELVARLTKGMRFTSLDPRGSGVFVLEGGGGKLWVWQNREGWTRRPGTSFTLEGIPRGTERIEVYDWKGRQRKVYPGGRSTLTVTGLAEQETHMFLAVGYPLPGME